MQETGIGGVFGETRRTRYVQLLEAYTPALRRLSNAYCANSSESDDLFQEIALALWTALPRFRGESSEKTWLYRVAHNVAFTFVGKTRRRAQREQSAEQAAEQVAGSDNPEATTLAEQNRQALNTAVRDLPVADRQLVLLYLEGLSAAEIEMVTGFTQSNVAVKLSRIRQRLAAQLRAKGVAQ